MGEGGIDRIKKKKGAYQFRPDEEALISRGDWQGRLAEQ